MFLNRRGFRTISLGQRYLMIDSFNNCPKGIQNEKDIERLGEEEYGEMV